MACEEVAAASRRGKEPAVARVVLSRSGTWDFVILLAHNMEVLYAGIWNHLYFTFLAHGSFINSLYIHTYISMTHIITKSFLSTSFPFYSLFFWVL